MKNFQFLKKGEIYSPESFFIAHLPDNIKGKKELLDQISIQLNFPDYFGFNWDALQECLQDFHWIKEKEIALVHHGLPILKESDLKIYLEILIEALQSWKIGDEHKLEIIFPDSAKTEIKKAVDVLE